MEKQSFISRLLTKHEWARNEYRELKEKLAATYPLIEVHIQVQKRRLFKIYLNWLKLKNLTLQILIKNLKTSFLCYL